LAEESNLCRMLKESEATPKLTTPVVKTDQSKSNLIKTSRFMSKLGIRGKFIDMFN
jgi:hypothetical protein